MSHIRDTEEVKPFLDGDESTSHRYVSSRRTYNALLPWAVSLISWLLTLYLLFSRKAPNTAPTKDTPPQSNLNRMDTTYFPTDLEAMRPAISYETRVFTGALYYDNSTKHFYRSATPAGPEYFGPPSEDIDKAWRAVLRGEWTPFTEAEAAPFRPELTPFNGPYPLFEPDVLHSLHCLNEVRKRIDIEYYSQPEHAGVHLAQANWDRIHIDHCLDQLRQTVLCFGDLSPVPLYYVQGAPLAIGRSAQHTCRKFDPIQQWLKQRRAAMNETG